MGLIQACPRLPRPSPVRGACFVEGRTCGDSGEWPPTGSCRSTGHAPARNDLPIPHADSVRRRSALPRRRPRRIVFGRRLVVWISRQLSEATSSRVNTRHGDLSHNAGRTACAVVFSHHSRRPDSIRRAFCLRWSSWRIQAAGQGGLNRDETDLFAVRAAPRSLGTPSMRAPSNRPSECPPQLALLTCPLG